MGSGPPFAQRPNGPVHLPVGDRRRARRSYGNQQGSPPRQLDARNSLDLDPAVAVFDVEFHTRRQSRPFADRLWNGDSTGLVDGSPHTRQYPIAGRDACFLENKQGTIWLLDSYSSESER